MTNLKAKHRPTGIVVILASKFYNQDNFKWLEYTKISLPIKTSRGSFIFRNTNLECVDKALRKLMISFLVRKTNYDVVKKVIFSCIIHESDKKERKKIIIYEKSEKIYMNKILDEIYYQQFQIHQK